MKRIADKTFSEERTLYATENAVVENCRFEGEEDGESFLKESKNIKVVDCFMDLRYPMWHVEGLKIIGGEMTINCRAALWYDKKVEIYSCKMNGIKALRECKTVHISDCFICSPEFGWRCSGVKMSGGELTSEYAFFESKNLKISGLEFTGKYSFQYVKNLYMKDCRLKTKDAFWHARDAIIEDCDIDGEYLGWYSDGLTLINCRIRGTQPLCYCTNLRLVDCVLEGCDLAFEYSDVEAEIRGKIDSVKNPKCGEIIADGYGEIILSGSKYPYHAQIVTRKN